MSQDQLIGLTLLFTIGGLPANIMLIKLFVHEFTEKKIAKERKIALVFLFFFLCLMIGQIASSVAGMLLVFENVEDAIHYGLLNWFFVSMTWCLVNWCLVVVRYAK